MNKGKILLIDDNRQDCEWVSELLKANAYTVYCEHNGINGLNKATDEKFDLIILELLLPDIKGQALYLKLKANKKTKNIPLIVLSANDNPDDIEELFKKDLDDYIIKPACPEYLLSKIETHIKR
jgi:two-component system alkaline phosphatase synthesis response regulator PhoP